MSTSYLYSVARKKRKKKEERRKRRRGKVIMTTPLRLTLAFLHPNHPPSHPQLSIITFHAYPPPR
jgi:hypothetical protein